MAKATAPTPPHDLKSLAQIMRDLRHPQTGCPWDLEQNFETIAPYTIEEAYEVADAIHRNAMDDLRDELGDLLLQVVYHAQIASEASQFDLNDVIAAICDKMVRRHPHVYGDAEDRTSEVQTSLWEKQKAEERGVGSSALDGVALALPALKRAQKIQSRAARVGFDWPDISGPRAKIDEELQEIEAANDAEEVSNELGDLLFSVVNFSRHLGVDAEVALRNATQRFEKRFRRVEALAGDAMTSASLAELDAYWEAAKAADTGD